ncbi:recombinase family protein [Psychrobacillus psychrodurans]|uniref:recombinase family protein n=1 Tax=Psychrobacillus psychrodurans TaxID=126157 RepID=UPI001F4DF943|nr:recombinase family protein [Psychrobacillus psychrodurans]MCK1997975.1 recombinase family protein [Psychrobacillus psychrodurans]
MIMYGYIRVSSVDQNEARQVATMKALGIDKANVYIDKISGRNTDRPAYQSLKERIQEGDTVVFDSITRLSRNYHDIKDEYEQYLKRGVRLQFVKEPMLNTPDHAVDDIVQIALADVILSLLAAFAQKERDDIKLRQAEGIAIAKAKGKYRGRKTQLVEGGEEAVRMTAIINAYKEGVSIADIRKTYKVGTGTIYRLLDREGLRK